MDENDDEKLTGAEKCELVLQAGMQAIPHVGGSLSALYFGAKQERRFKRLESFYSELANEVSTISDQIAPIEEQNADALAAILESLHEKVEAEAFQEKRQFFKNYFKNTLRHPITTNFDKRKCFLDTIAEMTFLECEMLSLLCTQSSTTAVGTIQKPNTDQYAIVGAINRLKSYGFVMGFRGSLGVGGGMDNALQEKVQASTFGKEFQEFCLEGNNRINTDEQ